jgi:hypothetical protein
VTAIYSAIACHVQNEYQHQQEFSHGEPEKEDEQKKSGSQGGRKRAAGGSLKKATGGRLCGTSKSGRTLSTKRQRDTQEARHGDLEQRRAQWVLRMQQQQEQDARAKVAKTSSLVKKNEGGGPYPRGPYPP